MDVLRYAKLQATIMGIIGLLLGIIYSVGGFFVDLFTIGLNEGTALAFGALIGMPLIGIIFGFVTGIIGAYLYNKLKIIHK